MTHTNRALRIHDYGGAETPQIDLVPMPAPGAGQALVRVRAAGVNGLDWKLRDGLLRNDFPLPLPATLGVELAGEIVGLGPDVEGFAVGDRVMSFLAGIGAYADFAVVDAAKLAHVPDGMDFVTAAATPVSGLAAAQGLAAAGGVRAGQRVLIHGAGGAVGGVMAQMAKAAGAKVIAVGSAASRQALLDLGVDQVIDRHAERFEDVAGPVDLVVDLVSGEAVDRSWAVLAPDGLLLSAATPDIAARAPAGRRALWFRTLPDRAQLEAVAQDVARGRLKVTLDAVVGMDGLAAAIERNKTGHGPGKTVVDMSRG